MNTSDTGEYEEHKNEQMPGGNLSAVFRKWTSIIEESDYYQDRKGRWHSIRFKSNNKIRVVIIEYQILEGSSYNIYTMKTQLDKVGNCVKLATNYQKDFLKDLTNYIALLTDVDDILVAANINESIISNNI